MSRHRDIRNMDYSEDYDGYDDVYGHSVDDDIYISPSHTQFMYNRESSGQSRSDYPMEEDIEEEDESEEVLKLTDEDKAKLESCLEHVKSVFAPMRMPRHELVKIIISQKFDCEKIVNSILKSQCPPPTERRDKDETNLSFDHSKQKFCSSLNTNSLSFTAQIVEPQSIDEVNFSANLYRSPNNAQPKNNTSNIPLDKNSFDECDSPSTSNVNKVLHQASRSLMTASSDSTSMFLAKIKNNINSDATGFQIENKLPQTASFLTKMKMCSKDIKTGNKSHEASFISKILKQDDVLKDSISNDFTSKLKLNSSFKLAHPHSSVEDSVESNTGREERNILEHTLSSENLKNISPKGQLKLNGIENKINDKLNLFFNPIERKENTNFVERIRSEQTLTTNLPSLSKDFSKPKVIEVKSMPSLCNNENDDSSDINLTAALQRSSFHKLKFRPVSNEEQFEIPFVDEEIDKEEDNILECTMDLSSLLTKRHQYSERRPSPMGLMLCLRYTLPKVKICKRKKKKLDPRLTIFNFLKPSPDDQIKKHVRRNL